MLKNNANKILQFALCGLQIIEVDTTSPANKLKKSKKKNRQKIPTRDAIVKFYTPLFKTGKEDTRSIMDCVDNKKTLFIIAYEPVQNETTIIGSITFDCDSKK